MSTEYQGAFGLPLEKQLSLADFNQQVEHMSQDQARMMLKQLMAHHLITQHSYQALLKKYMLGLD